jgi:putative transposase
MNHFAPQEVRTFFITSVTHQRRRLFQMDRMSHLLLDVLKENREKSRFQLHEFVVMPNHFHLIMTPAPEISLEKAGQFIKGGFSYRAKKELNYRFEVWERGFTDQRIRDAEDYQRYRNYIHQNPVRAGICVTPEEYPYSSARSNLELDPVPPWLKPRQ